MAGPDSDAGIRILLVEDDPDTRASIAKMLKRRGVDVVPTESAEEALNILEASPQPDAIVADIRLGGMSGVDLLRHIRETDADFPVILLTGYDSIESAIDAVRLGAQDYIVKPLKGVDELLLPVRKAVQSRRLLVRNRALENRVRESEIRLRTLFDNMSSGVIVFRPAPDGTDFLVADVNGAAERIEGIDRESSLGKPVRDVLEHADEFKLPELLSEVHRTGHPVRCPLTLFRSGAIAAARDCHVYRLPTNEVVVVFDDVTDRRLAECREKELRERLARAERMESVGILAGGVAHDLNNIVGSMVVLPALIREELGKQDGEADIEQVFADLSSMQSAAKQSVDIIRDLLAMSRRRNYAMTPVDLNDIVEECLDSAAFRAARESNAGVEITTNLCSRCLAVQGSASHLMQVFMNLTINALESMPRGGMLALSSEIAEVESSMLRYELIEAGEYAVVHIRDTGEGIAAEDLGRIFEPFYSGKQTSAKSGTGLGLAVVHGIVKDHGGYVDVTSEPGRGTEFTVYLPTTTDHVATEAEEVTGVSGSGRILVVDDVPAQLELADRILRKLGYDVLTAPNGREAVEILRRTEGNPASTDVTCERFDLVLLDMMLDDDFDGLTTYSEIVKIRPGQKCIIVSGFSETDRVKEAENLGVGQFMCKPYTIQKLGRAVREELTRGACDGSCQ